MVVETTIGVYPAFPPCYGTFSRIPPTTADKRPPPFDRSFGRSPAVFDRSATNAWPVRRFDDVLDISLVCCWREPLG